VQTAQENPTWSNQRIADALDVSEASVRRGLHKANFTRFLIPEDGVGDRFTFDLDEPMEVFGPAMITADWHIPLYDPQLANRMILEARERNLTQLIIAGDFFNYDSLSQYDPKQTDAGLEREHREGLAVMKVLLETFDSIYYIWGNHDARMHKALASRCSSSNAMKMVFGELGDQAMDRLHFSTWITCGCGLTRMPRWTSAGTSATPRATAASR
jgi:hypothetical protein